MTNDDLINRITYHLSSGGLFNPELADHLTVRNLLMECREALAHPEQEPVGDFYITKDMAEHIKKLEVDWTICASGSKRPTEKKVVPVFVGNTTPPQRKPLMDEEIETYRYMIDWTAHWSYIDFARAIEAAHGIKGEQ